MNKMDSKKRKSLALLFIVTVVAIIIACLLLFYFTKPEVKSITLDNSLLTLNEGEGFDLSYQITPKRLHSEELEVLWKSSDESIAEVNKNGVVVAKKAGNCDIEVIAENGKSDICHVIVNGIEDFKNSDTNNLQTDNSALNISNNDTNSNSSNLPEESNETSEPSQVSVNNEEPAIELNFSLDVASATLHQTDPVWMFTIDYCDYFNHVISLFNKMVRDDFNTTMSQYEEYDLILREIDSIKDSSYTASQFVGGDNVQNMAIKALECQQILLKTAIYAEKDRSQLERCKEEVVEKINEAYNLYTTA